ncbi:MAG TPA: cytochrome b/b6 domain-containing protein, partial [Usitatibacter sp.]|nr:cytochrome b/b6 domain-containing protein [Usitatibacter sp.]
MRLDTPDAHSGTLAIAFHWLVAILIVGLLALGLYMVRLPDVGFDKRKITLVLWHKEYGMLVLVLAFARLAWRVRAALPRLEPHLPDWQKI